MINPAADSTYSILQVPTGANEAVPTVDFIRSTLEKGSDEAKVDTMKSLLVAMLNGEFHGNILMHVIRFVMPSKDKKLKKLCHLFWEICPKTNPDGKLKAEMILVCNALRNELQHPNEYVRGSCLRFLCKLREPELLEPLVPSCRANLEHRHPYVRRTAVLAVYTVYKHSPNLLPDAPDLIMNLLRAESDQACRRNELIMLQNCAPDKALAYLEDNLSNVATFDESLQQVVVELLRKECRSGTRERAKYVRTLFVLLEKGSGPVRYEAASSLLALSSSINTLRAVASCYIQLAVKESDNNVKLIVLDRLAECHDQDAKALNGLHMDLLGVLGSTDIEVRRKCLDLVLAHAEDQNAEEIARFIQAQLQNTFSASSSFDKTSEYRLMLIKAIRNIAVSYSSRLASLCVSPMVEFLQKGSKVNQSAAVEVIGLIREVMLRFEELRSDILHGVTPLLASCKSGRVLRGILWVVGEYTHTENELYCAIQAVSASIGVIPIGPQGDPDDAEEKKWGNVEKSTTSPKERVLQDGTYKTEVHLGSTSSRQSNDARPPIRNAILSGDFFTASVAATSLTKLFLRLRSHGIEATKLNHITAEMLLFLTSMIRAGTDWRVTKVAIDEDSVNHIWNCFYTISNADNASKLEDVYLSSCQTSFSRALDGKERTRAKIQSLADRQAEKGVQPDDPIAFRFLKTAAARLEDDTVGLIDYDAMDITTAMGAPGGIPRFDDRHSKLNRIIQLTGSSDRVYAEAVVHVHHYDIIFDVLIVNQTSEHLRNVTLELATLGDLKLVERPAPGSIAPYKFYIVKANVKVSSTETGVIFGNILYEAQDETTVLDDIHVDIMDYIRPASCEDNKFRSMWTEFEWENKVTVKTNLSNLREYLEALLQATNMRCLTPESSLEGNCNVLAANLYAKSVFGEDALANICIERNESGDVAGHLRIRSKTQGIALSLGDKITLFQRNLISERGAASIPQLFHQLLLSECSQGSRAGLGLA